MHRELADAGGAWEWFVLKAAEGFRSGKITRGRATAHCRTADYFFTMLAGGNRGLESLKCHAFRCHDSIVIGSNANFEYVNTEIIEYVVCRHLTDARVKKAK